MFLAAQSISRVYAPGGEPIAENAVRMDIILSMILTGKVLTMSEPARVEAVYLEGDRIADLGQAADLSARYPKAKKLSFEQITPGLHDAHTHPLHWGEALGILDLAGVTDPREAAERVARYAKNQPAGAWVRGAGYLLRDYPSSALLDEAAPHNPVFLRSRDFHSCWVNQQALNLAHINTQTPNPEGGVVVRDASGSPTGYLLEQAQGLVLEVMPKAGLTELERGLRDLARRGYTATHHMGLCSLELAETLAKAHRIPLRLWWALDRAHWQGVQPGWRGDCLEVAAVKFFVDGALGSRTAWMVEPYPDTTHGMALDALEDLRSEGQKALEAGFSVVAHAIGTQAVKGLLEVFSDLTPLTQALHRPLRMEHVQHVRDEEIPKFTGLPLAISMQPMHALADAALVRHHLPGKEREAFRLLDLWNTGLPMALGSDAPVAEPDVRLNLEAATHHPLTPAQSLSPWQVLWAHTRGAALAAGWNAHGLIGPEAPADLTLWEAGKPIGRVFRGELELPGV